MAINILIIILSIAFISGLVLYIIKREFLKKHQGMVEYGGILLSLIIALFTIKQTQEGIDGSTKDFNNLVNRLDSIVGKIDVATGSLTKVEKSLEDLPSRIDNFSNSIHSLDSVINSQKEQLTTTLEGFNNSIEGFKTSVDIMAERFNRKPNIDIDFVWFEDDTCVFVKTVVIKNSGSLVTEVYMVRFVFEDKEELLLFEIKDARKDQDYAKLCSYQIDYQNPPIYITTSPIKPTVIRGDIILKKNFSSKVTVVVYYRAAFGNDGTSEKNLSFN